jgi:hypothetical protein
MDLVTGDRDCPANSNKHTLQLYGVFAQVSNNKTLLLFAAFSQTIMLFYIYI